MSKISGQAAHCRKCAVVCHHLSLNKSYDPQARAVFADMARRWRALAKSYRLAEELSGYIEWRAKRVA